MADDDDKKKSAKKGLSAFGQSMNKRGQDMIESAREASEEASRAQTESSRSAADESLARNRIPSMKRGGVVRRTGLVRLHKGERVIPRGARKIRRIKTGRY